jgi:hypothetical protein
MKAFSIYRARKEGAVRMGGEMGHKAFFSSVRRFFF